MKEIFMILVSAILVDNFVLSKFMGICPFLGVSKKLDSAVGMGLAVTFVMIMASAVTYPIYRYLLLQFDLTYLNTLVFILVIAAFVQLVEIVLKKFIPALHKSLGVYLPLITTNCAGLDFFWLWSSFPVCVRGWKAVISLNPLRECPSLWRRLPWYPCPSAAL